MKSYVTPQQLATLKNKVDTCGIRKTLIAKQSGISLVKLSRWLHGANKMTKNNHDTIEKVIKSFDRITKKTIMVG